MPLPQSKIEIPNSKIQTEYPLRFPTPDQPTPFPTIYWLTDPTLDHALADLERRGIIRQLDACLHRDAVLLETFRADHQRYRAQRWAMLTQADRSLVEASPSLMRSFRGGVAGIADFDTIKCLHAHVAHHLAEPQGNTIARLLIERHALSL